MRGSIYDAMEDQIPHLRRYARALTYEPESADDLVQDTLERAIARIDSFREGTDLRAWMFTILHNLHIDRCRRHQRRGVHMALEEWRGDRSRPAEQPEHVELRELAAHFPRLQGSERAVIELVGVQGMKYEEAAERLGVAVGTVKSRLSRARHALKRLQEGAPR